MSSRISNHSLLKYWKSEEPPINSDGFLTIKWPEEVCPANRVETLDFLIATVTVPTLCKGEYPTVDRIADAMKQRKYCEYFCKNREYGITTFQDARILELIAESEP